MPQKRNVMIVLCAGQGKRMGGTVPKMMLQILGKPILYWTLKNLESCRQIHEMIIAVPPGRRKKFEQELRRWHLSKVSRIVDGGNERTDSTRNALKAVSKDAQFIGIHDGARPFVTHRELKQCFSAAEKTGAAILAVPSKDTIKVAGKNGMIQETIPRSSCWMAQTPQIFRKDIALILHGIVKSAKKNQSFDGMSATDDASLAERFGFKVRLVSGSYKNIKITTPEDLVPAEALLKKGLKTRDGYCYD